MSNFYDYLINTKYGNLNIINIIFDNNHTRSYKNKKGETKIKMVPCAECICKCGNKKIIPAGQIVSKKTPKYCGNGDCPYSTGNRKYIKSGTKFGNFTVIEFAYIKYEMTHYKCKCTCGRTEIVRRQWLISGSYTMCKFCSTKRNYSWEIPKIGDKINNTKIIKMLSEDFVGENTIYLCKCQFCSKLFNIRYSSLKLKNKVYPQSCGCSNKGSYKHGKSNTNEYRQFYNSLRREKKLKLDTKWTYKMKESILQLQTRCVNCGSIDRLEIDHVYPLSKGYGLKPGNACVLCKSCNSTKRNKLPEELDNTFRTNILNAAIEFKEYWEGTQ